MARAWAGGSAKRSCVPAGRERRLLIAVAGSDRGGADARRELRKALDGADDSFRAKLESRRKLERYTQLSLPGDPLLAQGIDWSKQNLADSVQVAEGLQVREVREGKQYPPPSGTRAARALLRRGLARLPVDVRDRRRVHGVRRGGARPVRAERWTICARCAT